MSGVYGTAYGSDGKGKAPGATVDAGLRRHHNVFNFADAGVGGTTNPLTATILREGAHLDTVKLSSGVDCSGINISVGITGSTAKYSAATAGPNATRKELVVKDTALDDDPLTAPETIILTPSGNWPATGKLIADLYASHR